MPKPEQLGVGLRRWGGAQSKGSAQQQLSGLQKPPALHLCLHWGWWSSQQPPPALRPQGAGPPACPSLRPATVRKEGVLWSVCMAVWAPRGPPGRLWGRTSVRVAWDHHCGWEGKDAGRAEAWPCRSSGARRPGEAIILGHLVSAARAGHCVTWREPHSGGRGGSEHPQTGAAWESPACPGAPQTQLPAADFFLPASCSGLGEAVLPRCQPGAHPPPLAPLHPQPHWEPDHRIPTSTPQAEQPFQTASTPVTSTLTQLRLPTQPVSLAHAFHSPPPLPPDTLPALPLSHPYLSARVWGAFPGPGPQFSILSLSLALRLQRA